MRKQNLHVHGAQVTEETRYRGDLRSIHVILSTGKSLICVPQWLNPLTLTPKQNCTLDLNWDKMFVDHKNVSYVL